LHDTQVVSANMLIDFSYFLYQWAFIHSVWNNLILTSIKLS